MRIIVASKNPVKYKACSSAFSSVFSKQTFSYICCSVESGVSSQPITDKETYIGARNRAQRAMKKVKNGDWYVGIEGGIADEKRAMTAFAWVVVYNKKKQKGCARTATFVLPEKISELIRQGVELGEADDRVFGRCNSKQDNGAVGLLTHNIITRTTYYEHAIILALIPFINNTLYYEGSANA